MPTLLRWNGFRFYIFSNERQEPLHVRIDKAGKSAKFWLQPISVAANYGYSPSELRQIHAKLDEHQSEFVRAWNEHFDT